MPPMKSDTEKDLYTFPKAEPAEYERLDIQHQIWSLMFDGLYPQEFKSKVESRMRQSGTPAAVLDVGCGSAIWSIQMARHFPQATVIGLDMTPLLPRDLPPNFSFKVHNLATGLPLEYQGKFDVIHCRTVLQHVPDPQGLIDSLAEALKPGGLLFIGDIEVVAYDESQKPLEPAVYHPEWSIEENMKKQESLSWYGGWCAALGSITYSPSYQFPGSHVQRSATLATLMAAEFWVPCGAVTEEDGKLAELITKDIQDIYPSSNEIFARALSQVPEEFRKALIERGFKEVTSQRHHIRFLSVVASKV